MNDIIGYLAGEKQPENTQCPKCFQWFSDFDWQNHKCQISKNFIKTDPVRSCEELIDMADRKESVYHHFWKIKPAAFITNMNFRIIFGLIKNKRLFKIKRIK
jgi:hypothetical protein